MTVTRLSAALACLLPFLVADVAFGQLSKEQLAKVRQDRAREQAGVTQRGTSDFKSPVRNLNEIIIDPVQIENAKARDAFRWWQNTTGINLIVNWNAIEASGIDPDTPVNLSLRNVPAPIVLSLLMKQLSPDKPLLYETTPWFIRVMTQEEADKDTVTLVYDVKDLITTIPNFTGAPEFDLNQALSNTSSGGSSGGAATASTQIFRDEELKEPQKTETERGEEIAALIRETIAPTIWQELGGEHGSVKYFRGQLIVKAPRYVHAQIGIPTVTSSQRSSGSRYYVVTPPSKGNSIAGVRQNVDKVAGVQKN